MSDIPEIFNRTRHRQNRDRAAPGLDAHDFLFCEVGARLADRVLDINRTFATALDLGCHGGEASRALLATGRVDHLVRADCSAAMVSRATADGAPGVVADEEALPFSPQAFDLVASSMTLHWVNDLPGTLAQARRALKPDGLFLAALAGAGTLVELGTALAEAEVEITGGLSPRVSPFADVRDLGNLLVRAGFALPVADTETVTVSYPDMFALIADLRGMGEAGALAARPEKALDRAVLDRAAALYAETHGDAAGRIPATFEIVFLTGWAPGEGQQKPSPRGSGKIPLAQALDQTFDKAFDDEKPG